MYMQVKELMAKKVITVTSDVHVLDAVKLMNKERIGCLLVVDLDKTVGILTERDILQKIVEKERDSKTTKVSEVMTKQVIVGSPTMKVAEAAELMLSKKVKKLPIVEGSKMVGLVTLTDIAHATSADQETIQLVEKLSNMHVI